MSGTCRAKFCGFLFGRRVADEIAAAGFGAGQVFEQVGRTQRWMDLDVKMEAFGRVAIRWRLMQCEDVRERKLPEIIVTYQHVL